MTLSADIPVRQKDTGSSLICFRCLSYGPLHLLQEAVFSKLWGLWRECASLFCVLIF